MAKFNKLLLISALASNLVWAGPGLDLAEVKLPYGELKSLITAATRPVANRGPTSALLSARFRFSMMEGKPVADALFRTTAFAEGLAMVPLVGGAVSVASQQPPDSRIVIEDNMLCQALEKPGSQNLEMRLLPVFGGEGAGLIIPACPAAIFETGELGAEWSLGVKLDGKEQVLGSNQKVALPFGGGVVEIRMLGGEETREALRPPEPSVWSWQQQALVIPGDGEIAYRVLGRASAASGSGVAAALALPADAREVKVTGDNLAGTKVTRGADRAQTLQIEWKTRGLLEREVAISYLLPCRPLDRKWKLQAPSAPGENATQTRFIIPGVPEFAYAADGLTGPFAVKGLPQRLTSDLKSQACYQIDAATVADLTVTPLPLVATADAIISEALWTVKLEPDGAMLVEGTMSLEHRGMLGVLLDVPPGMTLLACNVGGKSASPVDAGAGKLEIHLAGEEASTRISCSFTGRVAAFDPVAGTLELALPQTPLFIRALTWKIELPRGYQAETHGNLVRVADSGDPTSRLTLRKNLCREERPETHVFYQRSDLKN